MIASNLPQVLVQGFMALSTTTQEHEYVILTAGPCFSLFYFPAEALLPISTADLAKMNDNAWPDLIDGQKIECLFISERLFCGSGLDCTPSPQLRRAIRKVVESHDGARSAVTFPADYGDEGPTHSAELLQDLAYFVSEHEESSFVSEYEESDSEQSSSPSSSPSSPPSSSSSPPSSSSSPPSSSSSPSSSSDSGLDSGLDLDLPAPDLSATTILRGYLAKMVRNAKARNKEATKLPVGSKTAAGYTPDSPERPKKPRFRILASNEEPRPKRQRKTSEEMDPDYKV
ncbi:hypothetical protein MSAN_00842600 [Mycena sanguinolenta]|uniref:Uncharacterized protein n=1 Tax=Mycena sanguinolenta TaxID=230812 RepID=A0A8H6YYU3_9AGAR|nr:hypothetical protein MSAN_00842600 [Mycena sanguinolenta]